MNKSKTSNNPEIIVITAPSGAGKSTLAKRLLSEFPNITFSVSATTRQPRNGEIHGRDYLFISKEEFHKRVENDEFLEWEEFYGGTRYGTLKSQVDDLVKKGYFCLLDVDVQGAVNVKRQFGDKMLTVFIKPPSFEELEKRLRSRGTETEQQILMRLERAKTELTFEKQFDTVVVNDRLDEAYNQLRNAVNAFISKKHVR